MVSKRREGVPSQRRYSNLMDLPGVNINNSNNSKVNPWMAQEFSIQEKRFFNDFRPFFLLCQLSGMFPNKLHWKLSFSWTYWATYFCLLNLIMMFILLAFYISQVQTLSSLIQCKIINFCKLGCDGCGWESGTSLYILQPGMVCTCGSLHRLYSPLLSWQENICTNISGL